MDKLQEYYNHRAQEYERKYARDEPARQGEQEAIAGELRRIFLNRRVLEVACGTGYWTSVIAEVAKHVTATDTSREMLAIARAKGMSPSKVEFYEADAYGLSQVPGEFDAGLANFWFSHVPKARTDAFLRGFHSRLDAGAVAFMCDDVYIPGVGGELVERAEGQDTYKLRKLSDDSQYEVLKNYYDAESLRSALKAHATGIRVHIGEYHWWVSYIVMRNAECGMRNT